MICGILGVVSGHDLWNSGRGKTGPGLLVMILAVVFGGGGRGISFAWPLYYVFWMWCFRVEIQ